MAARKFSSGEAISFGWEKMKANFGFFVGLLIVAGLLSVVPSVMLTNSGKALARPVIMTWIDAVWQAAVGIGLIQVALRFCDNEKAELSDILPRKGTLLNVLFGSLLGGLIILAGLILLIIPGIILAVRLQFVNYLIIDKRLAPIDALKKSFAITKGAEWGLFVFGVLTWLIDLLGLLCLVVGLFAAVPTTMVATAFVYRKLLAQTEAVPTQKSSKKPVKRTARRLKAD